MYKKVRVEKDQIYYWEQGDGDVLVFIPSLWITDLSYRSISKRLSESYKVIIPDLNRSKTKYCRNAKTLEEHAEKIKQLVDTLKIDRFFLLGTSFGGLVALKYAEMFPTDVKKVLSVSALPLNLKGKYSMLLLGYLKAFFLNSFSLKGIRTNFLWFVDGLGYLVRHPRQFLYDGLMAVEDHQDLSLVPATVWFANKDEFLPHSSLNKISTPNNLRIIEINGRHAWFFLDEVGFVQRVKQIF